MNQETLQINLPRNSRFLLFLFIALSIIVILVIYFLEPIIAGDGMDYLNAISFLETGNKSIDFSPNRLLTTFGGLQLIMFFSSFFNSLPFAWIFINIVFYFLFNFFFYRIILGIHKDEKVALVSTLFLATNYGLLAFGLNFLLDMGGWFFYCLSLYFMWRYAETSDRRSILKSALSVGIGLLFKEYAVLGIIPIAFFLTYENINSRQWFLILKNILKKAAVPALLSVIPLLVLYFYIYFKFGYTYLDWLQTNKERYGDMNKIVEYIKSFGSLLQILTILFIFGVREFIRQSKFLDTRTQLFIAACFLSFMPLFVWPGITQRVLFISMPAIIIVSSFCIDRYKRYIYVFIPLLVAYFLLNLYMDSFVLDFVNLPF